MNHALCVSSTLSSRRQALSYAALLVLDKFVVFFGLNFFAFTVGKKLFGWLVPVHKTMLSSGVDPAFQNKTKILKVELCNLRY